ncbi:hypothetical protein [Streptomyces sp. PAM3C]|uniref:hypothetical protein n=1 Tax=Streptomyces sp. PAM3C TaxID=2847300 RepID=UPI0027E22F23|nr:hypothetical protein [Streptomyces sp. PAM3C]
MTPQDPGVYIPPAQMYQELRSLSDGVTRVETKLDGIAQGLTDLGKDVADHETRLRALESQPKGSDIEPRVSNLERARWPLPSIAAVTGVAGTVFGALAFFQR